MRLVAPPGTGYDQPEASGLEKVFLMAGISSISGTQAAAQSGLQQLRLQQAERNARQAEQTARALQAEARDAQQKLLDAKEEARLIGSQADQAQANAGRARQGLAALRTVGELQSRLSSALVQVREKSKIAEPAAPSQGSTPAVLNAQGQTTGSVINTTA